MDNGLVFNNLNVKNDGTNPDPIQVPNAITYKPSIGLSFQHITRHGLMYGAGFQYGSYNHDVDIVYNSFDFVDTFKELRDLSYKFSYRNKSSYLGINLFIGYSQQLTNNGGNASFIDAKVGITKRMYFTGGYSEGYLSGAILSNDTIFAGYTPVYINDEWGNSRGKAPSFLDAYIGLRKSIGWHCLGDVNIGFFSTYLFEISGVSAASFSTETEVRNAHYIHGVFQYYSTDRYVNKEVTFGIRAGFGLNL